MAGNDLILGGDIGATKTHLALFSLQGNKLKSEFEKTFPSQEYSGLEPVLREFLAVAGNSADRACFGIAGPVVEGKVKTPNLSWVVDAGKIAETLKLASVSLLNDLQAAAYGIFTLEPHEFLCLNQGVARRPGNKVLIAAGTGLGEAIIYDDGRKYHPLASEGGHADFAPRDDLEIELLRYLIPEFGHVSVERVVSGPGLLSVYNFLKHRVGLEEPSWFEKEISGAEDPSAFISKAALEGEPEIPVKALDMFVSVYGAEAGNLALKGNAMGGVYVGGGIAPKIKNKLLDGIFMRAFIDKGRYEEFLSSIPVYVILNDRAALRGAAHYASLGADG
ncbi:MAG: glucokinase [Candidatus Binatia bacterium]